MTVCESDSGLCWDLDEETLARAILTFCLNTADALMTALLKGTADAWEALTLIRDSDPELRTSAGAGKVIEQAFCIGMTRWGSKPTPQAVAAAIANSPHVGQGLSLRLVHHGGEAMDHRAA